MKRNTLIAWLMVQASMSFCSNAVADRRNGEQVRPTNDLPNMVISFSDGSQIHAKKLMGNTIIILFFPDCDHCQREAAQIQKNLASFKNYTLYFLSTATKQETDKFAADYKLKDVKNIRFGAITVQDVFSNFGSVPTPSLYIYSSDHKLVQSFKGETEIGKILMYVK